MPQSLGGTTKTKNQNEALSAGGSAGSGEAGDLDAELVAHGPSGVRQGAGHWKRHDLSVGSVRSGWRVPLSWARGSEGILQETNPMQDYWMVS